MKLVTYDEWESGRVRLDPAEIFDAVEGRVVGIEVVGNEIREVREVIGYLGRTSLTPLGPWFGDVLEQQP